MQTTHRTPFLHLTVPILLIIGYAGCHIVQSSIQQRNNDTHPADLHSQKALHLLALPTDRMFCNYCSIEGTAAIEADDLSASAEITFLLARRDSLQATIYGPFGILLSRLFSTTRELILFDALSMSVYEKQITPQTVAQMLALPVTMEELFALLRCEVPFPDSSYRLLHMDSTYTTLIHIHDTTFVDLAKINSDGLLLAYQRKTHQNQLLFAITYDNYHSWEGDLYPLHIRLTIPSRKLTLMFMTDTVDISLAPTSFRFPVPQSVRRIGID